MNLYDGSESRVFSEEMFAEPQTICEMISGRYDPARSGWINSFADKRGFLAIIWIDSLTAMVNRYE
jgi:ABC-type oligopeptide transport system substrate-binding subunit